MTGRSAPVVCGIDPELRGVVAARQALRISPPGARLLLVAAVDADAAALAAQPPPLTGADWGTPLIPFDVPRAIASLEEAGHASLERARTGLGTQAPVETRPAAGRAAAVAHGCGCPLRVVVARGGRVDDAGVERTLAGLLGAERVDDPRHPTEALADPGDDLVVVGSRGLHGLRALGSVSERVAHRSSASVPMVHAPLPDAGA